MNRCPKCTGCLATAHGDTRCLNCGFRDGDLTREMGREGVDPTVLESLCVSCRRNPRMTHRRCCKTCLYRASKRAQRLREEARREKMEIGARA